MCEVGFNAGFSSLVWLSAGAGRVHSFELGQYPHSRLAAAWLQARFPGRLQVRDPSCVAGGAACVPQRGGSVCYVARWRWKEAGLLRHVQYA